MMANQETKKRSGSRREREHAEMLERRRLPDQAFARSWTSIAGGRRRIGGWTPTVRLRKRPGAS